MKRSQGVVHQELSEMVNLRSKVELSGATITTICLTLEIFELQSIARINKRAYNSCRAILPPLFDTGRINMKLTISLEDKLVEEAKFASGISETSKLLRRSVEYIVAYERGEREYRSTGSREDFYRTLRQIYEEDE